VKFYIHNGGFTPWSRNEYLRNYMRANTQLYVKNRRTGTQF